MQDKKPRVLYEKEDVEQLLGEMSARHGIPKKRLRGLAIEYAVDHSGDEGDFTEYLYMRGEAVE